MHAISAPAPSTRSVAMLGLGFIACFVAMVTWIMNTATYREWGGLVVAVGIVIVSIPILSKQARREENPRVFWFLLIALLVKLLFAAIRHYVTFDLYGVADAVVYNRFGTEIANGFRAGDFTPDLPSFTDTEFIKLLTGIVYTFMGPTTWGGFLFFGWLSFLGVFLMYRAFKLAVPGASRAYGGFLFFLPSLLFWPSSIGKEGWMLFALGIAVFGCARAFTGSVARGLPLIVVGSALAGVVRPHVAGFVGVGIAGAVLMMRPSKEKLGELAPIVRTASLVAVIGLLATVVISAGSFLQDAGIETEEGLSGTLASVSERTSKGDSSFSTPSLTSPLGLPLAVVTVLFRPFVFEASNSQMLMTAAEGVFLMLFSVVRIPSVWSAVRSVRQNPFMGFALVYTAVSIIGLSSLGNFGLLARQRTMLFPIYLALLLFPRQRNKTPEEASSVAV